MLAKKTDYLYFLVGVFLPFLAWFTVTAIYGSKHEEVAFLFYALYLYLWTYYWSARGRGIIYPFLVLVSFIPFLGLAWFFSQTSWQAAMDWLFLLFACLTWVGSSFLALLSRLIMKQIRDLFDHS